MAYEIRESHGKEYKVTDNGTFYPVLTPDDVIKAVEHAKAGRYRVRVFIGYTEEYAKRTGSDPERPLGTAWPEEFMVTGYIGRTTGQIKSPILVHNERSMGGCIISTDCIVGLKVNGCAGGWLYRHKAFNAGNFMLVEADPDNIARRDDGLFYEVHNFGEVQARFNTREKAQRYIQFMRGERGSK